MTTTVNTINGNEGNNRLTGTSRNDVINGNGGNDRLNGGSGEDTLNGGAGKDELNGGSGNDVLDGGSGSDELKGGSGNDRFIYTLSENNVKGTYDEYDGGSGSDTLELRFTRAEWMNEDNQKMLQSYLKWASKSGSGCRWDDDFTFRFGNARLEIEDIEKLVVKVDGATIDNLGMNTVDAVDDAPEKSITEDVTDVQKIYFLSNDKVNYLVKDVKLELSTTKGDVLLVKDDLDNTETWYFRYKPSDTFYQYLQSNMTEKDTFKYTVIDAKGKEDTATVTITITGISDAADITFEYSSSPELTEDINFRSLPNDTGALANFLTSSGYITIQDKDFGQSELLKINPYPDNLGKLNPYFNPDNKSKFSYTYEVENSKVQYLAKDKIKEEKFTIVSADGTTKNLIFTIKGVNDAAAIGGTTIGSVTEKGSSNGEGSPNATGSLTARDVDNPPDPENPATFRVVTGQESINKYGKYSITADGNWTYKLDNDNDAIKALNSNSDPLEDTFTIKSIDGTPQEIKITINGADDGELIGDSLTKQLIEDKDVNSQGSIVLQGTLLISGAANQGADQFLDGTYPSRNNIGTMGFKGNGQYYYFIVNNQIQFLGEGKTHTDYFTVLTADGSSKQINFVTTGVNDKPVVKELGQGENKYAGSANVEELINLDHFKSSPAINTDDIKFKAKYDFDHVRTGQFLVSDVDVGDKLTVSNKPTKPDEKIGNLETEILQVKDFGGNPIVGKYVVNWTYTVKDSELDPLDKGVDGKPTKDQKFTVTIGDGTATVDTEVVLHLFGRDEIEFVDGENEGNNIILGGDGVDVKYENPGNDVFYLGEGYELVDANDGGDVIYGENGGGNFSLQSNDSVIFGGDKINFFNHTKFSDNGLIFGGNDNDEFYFVSTDPSKRVYSWGGGGKDNFLQFGSTTNQRNNWIMDFNPNKPSEGGDEIRYSSSSINDITVHKWDPAKTQLVQHTANSSHPFLSDDATYYELRVQSSIDKDDTNWYSVFNLVGFNGMDITLDGLFNNDNLKEMVLIS